MTKVNAVFFYFLEMVGMKVETFFSSIALDHCYIFWFFTIENQSGLFTIHMFCMEYCQRVTKVFKSG